MTVQDEFAVTSVSRLHYRDWGARSRSAVLLLHGLTGNAWEWDPVAAALSSDHRVVALNQRGHGASRWADDYAAERMVDDLCGFCATLELDAVTVVGHSMGGLNAFLFAASRPDLVERLAIVDFGPDSLTPEAATAWATSLRSSARAVYRSPAEAVEEWRSANPRAGPDELAHFVTHNLAESEDGGWRWRFDAAGLESFLDQLPDEHSQWAALEGLECPTLVIRGEHSEVLSRETAERMERELPDAELVEIGGGAHDLTVEQPAALTEALSRWLAASPSRPAVA